MRCLQSFCYIFCGSKFLPTCRADDYSEFSRNLATVWRRAWIIRIGQRRDIIRETVQDVCRNNPNCCIICFNLVIARCSQICASMGEAACLQIRIRCMSSIYYQIKYGQFIDLSGSEWLAPLAIIATTVVVTTLSVVLPTVGTLAISPQVTTALDGVVLYRNTLGTEAILALQSSVGTLTATCHNNSFWSRAENCSSPQIGVSQTQWLWAKH